MIPLEGSPILTAEQMLDAERKSVTDGATARDYMLTAGAGLAMAIDRIREEAGRSRSALILVGKGNNGGDGCVVGMRLLERDYQVILFQLFPESELSPLCLEMLTTFKQAGGDVKPLFTCSNLPCLTTSGLIVDALLGTGMKGRLEPRLHSLATHINRRKNGLVIAIDIPSGLQGTRGLPEGGEAILADKTLCLGAPKIGCFVGDGNHYVGKIETVDFGLPPAYLDDLTPPAYLLQIKSLLYFLPKTKWAQHKYQSGYITIVAGSPGMGGAAILAALGALRTGAGLVHLFYPEAMRSELSVSPLEVIKTPYSQTNLAYVKREIERSSVCVLGPGMGMGDEVKNLLLDLIEGISTPLVIDADGLKLLKGMFKSLCVPCILTPHAQEMAYLLGLDRLPKIKFVARCREFAEERGITLVLKGYPTCIFHPGRSPLFIPRGDPGMATAGSGDLLAGMLGACWSKTKEGRVGAALGVCLHALAGEIAASTLGSYSLIASDLLAAISSAWKELLAAS